MVEWARSADPLLRRMLENHPRVGSVTSGPEPGVAFGTSNSTREVKVGDRSLSNYGLVELMDNNPIVCASQISVPSASATLALIAFGPLVEAGILVEAPSLLLSSEIESEDTEDCLTSLGGHEGITFHTELQPLGTVLAATAIAAIQTPQDLSEIDDLYEERYGRSFFVRHDESSEWDISLVSGRPEARYRLRIAEDQPHSLLTIRVMADLNGKAGAAQVIHAFNVMNGFEESLGIPTLLESGVRGTPTQ